MQVQLLAVTDVLVLPLTVAGTSCRLSLCLSLSGVLAESEDNPIGSMHLPVFIYCLVCLCEISLQNCE